VIHRRVLGLAVLAAVVAGCTAVAPSPVAAPLAGAQCRIDGPPPCSVCAVTCPPGKTARCVPGEVLSRGPAFAPLCVRDSVCRCE
jgi:hypothetical protein